MTRILFFAAFVSLALLLLAGVNVLLLRLLNREWWQFRVVRKLSWLLPVLGMAFGALWALAHSAEWTVAAMLLRVGLATVFVLLASQIPAQLIAGGLHLLVSVRKSAAVDTAPDSGRRQFLKRAAVAAPALGAVASIAGLTSSFAGVRVYRHEMSFDNLPPDLEGFRILHLSDLHLGPYATPDDLAAVLERAGSLRPDVVLMTGDVADELDMLPETLRLVTAFGTPHGAFTSLGNHEYFRGVRAVRKIHDGSDVPLMVNETAALQVGGATVHIHAIDDPRHMGADHAVFFEDCLEKTVTASGEGDFSILMSHRPAVFDSASRRGVDLTVAGHTHGAQMGMFGRSFLEPFWPEAYLWGSYRKDRSRLYTSSGVGHWFPFRLGCPPEAPVIELTQS